MLIDVKSGPMLTVTEVADMLHVHSNTVRQWTDKGLIKNYRINKRGDRRFTLDDVMDFLVSVKSGNLKP